MAGTTRAIRCRNGTFYDGTAAGNTKAPSVFAAAPQAGVSERYLFLPTSTIISRMRQEGWAPVEVQQQAVRVEGRMGFQKHLLRLQRRDQIAMDIGVRSIPITFRD